MSHDVRPEFLTGNTSLGYFATAGILDGPEKRSQTNRAKRPFALISRILRIELLREALKNRPMIGRGVAAARAQVPGCNEETAILASFIRMLAGHAGVRFAPTDASVTEGYRAPHNTVAATDH